MKITKRQLKSIIRETWVGAVSLEKGGEKYGEGGKAKMAKSQLFQIANSAAELHDMLSEDDELPEWVQSKIAVIEDNIDAVLDHLQYKHRDSLGGEELAEAGGYHGAASIDQSNLSRGASSRDMDVIIDLADRAAGTYAADIDGSPTEFANSILSWYLSPDVPEPLDGPEYQRVMQSFPDLVKKEIAAAVQDAGDFFSDREANPHDGSMYGDPEGGWDA